MRKITFLPHQKAAIERLRTGSILCGGVGTGKSLTALGYFCLEVCGGAETESGAIGNMSCPRDLYIITTARKRDTHEWDRECENFDLSQISVTVDSWNNLAKYEGVTGAFFIFDEQRVVGNGAWTKSFLKIAKANPWILLSATPGDSWSDYIPVFLANGFYKNRTEFLRRHAVYSRYCTRYPKIERWLEVGYLESLRRRITVVMEFEKKTEPHWEYIETDYDRALYDRILKDRWDPYKEEPVQDISGACYLMRRVASSGETAGSINHSDFSVNTRALDILHLLMRKHPKLIVFYNYDYELEAMKTTFEEMRKRNFCVKQQYAVAEWNGHRHEDIPDAERWIYLVQYNAGAEGWNCVQTDAIIFYSQTYSYKMMTQAAGRIDRMNTPFTDLYYYVFTSDAPIEKAIRRTLRNKKSFNEKNFLQAADPGFEDYVKRTAR